MSALINCSPSGIKITPYEIGEWLITVGEWPEQQQRTVQFVNKETGTACRYVWLRSGRFTPGPLFGPKVSPAMLELMKHELEVTS